MKMTVPEELLEIALGSVNVNHIDNHPIWSISGNEKKEEKVYTYDEAIGLAGNGRYILGLLGLLIIAYLGMGLDMFGFSVVISGACDLDLTHYENNILLSLPFLGPIVMAYLWGYIADTQGRLRALKYSLFGSFIFATASAFSPNWKVLAVLKIFSVSFSSGIQSLGLTLLGESCSPKLKKPIVLAISTSIMFMFAVYSVLGYFILKLQVSIDLGFIVFSNWRLLALVLALPFGTCLMFSTIYYESPKFLLNAGNQEQALKILKAICKRNGADSKEYPVKQVKLNEIASLKQGGISFLESLKNQTFPLFKPPLLYHALKLFYVTAVLYSLNNGLFSWTPFVVDSFYSTNDSNTTSGTMCDIIANSEEIDDTQDVCIGTVKESTVWIAIVQGILFMLLSIIPIVFSKRRKAILISIYIIVSCSSVLLPLVSGRFLVISMFFGFMTNTLCIPIVFSFYADMFPTSYRGMATCLGVIVARLSGFNGTILFGIYLGSHCATLFYASAFLSLSAALVAWFLPVDDLKKEIV